MSFPPLQGHYTWVIRRWHWLSAQQRGPGSGLSTMLLRAPTSAALLLLPLPPLLALLLGAGESRAHRGIGWQLSLHIKTAHLPGCGPGCRWWERVEELGSVP